MNIIVVLIAISLSMALLFLSIFFWNIRTGQYDDTITPSIRMLFDEKIKKNDDDSKTPDKNQPSG